MNKILNLIDVDTEAVCHEYSLSPPTTDNDFDLHEHSHCDLIDFSVKYNQLVFWTRVKNRSIRSRYCIASPNNDMLKAIWERSPRSRKCIKEFLIVNAKNYNDPFVISVVLGCVEEL